VYGFIPKLALNLYESAWLERCVMTDWCDPTNDIRRVAAEARDQVAQQVKNLLNSMDVDPNTVSAAAAMAGILIYYGTFAAPLAL
jgi:hypothetical protein